MKMLVLLSFLLLTAAPASRVYAGNVYQYSSMQVPVIATDGTHIGMLHIEQRTDSQLWLDYDFDSPADCQVTSLSTTLGSNTKNFNLNQGKQIAPVDGVEGTYITPRDAVLRLTPDTSQLASGIPLTSSLTFSCPTKQLTAHTGTVLLQRSATTYTDTGIGTRIVTRIRSWVDGQTSGDGYTLRFDQGKNQWYWQQSTATPRPIIVRQTSAGYGTPRRTSTLRNHFYEGRTSGDGYYLHYNTAKDQWCWRSAGGTC